MDTGWTPYIADKLLEPFRYGLSFFYYNSENEYQQGLDCEGQEKYGEAFDWFQTAANHCHVLALDKIGQYYYEGKHVPRDIEKSYDSFLQITYFIPKIPYYTNYTKISDLAKRCLIQICIDRPDKIEDHEFLEAVAVIGDKEFLFGYGLFLEQSGLIKLAIKQYELAAEKGHCTAMHNLGCLTKKDDLHLALRYFEKAAKENFPYSLTVIGDCFRDGIGYSKNIQKAIQSYTAAASHTNPDPKAFYALSSLYKQGIGVEQDLTRAFEYLKEAADRGYSEAQFDLGLNYCKGIGIEKDSKMAFKYIELAADLEYADRKLPSAHKVLGCHYHEGKEAGADSGSRNAQGFIPLIRAIENDDLVTVLEYAI